jgi:hypothetical protein
MVAFYTPETDEASTFEVSVIQHLRPDGRQRHVFTQLPAEVAGAYEDMTLCGCWFKAEVLTTGEVCVTISNDEENFDASITPNTPSVQEGMAKMLARRQWRNQ